MSNLHVTQRMKYVHECRKVHTWSDPKVPQIVCACTQKPLANQRAEAYFVVDSYLASHVKILQCCMDHECYLLS
jgi:hypothetical protein